MKANHPTAVWQERLHWIMAFPIILIGSFLDARDIYRIAEFSQSTKSLRIEKM
jgi:hypothetical protein